MLFYGEVSVDLPVTSCHDTTTWPPRPLLGADWRFCTHPDQLDVTWSLDRGTWSRGLWTGHRREAAVSRCCQPPPEERQSKQLILAEVLASVVWTTSGW